MKIRTTETFFNGFDREVSIENGKNQYICNIKRILSETEVNCFFNLHGSIHFNTVPNEGTINPSIRMTYSKEPQAESEYISNSAYADKSNIIDQRIITGQQKIIHTTIEPYQSFFNAFQKDCIFANTILIVGASLNDYHISKEIKKAIYQFKDDDQHSLQIVVIIKDLELNELNINKRIFQNINIDKVSHDNISPKFKRIKNDWFESQYCSGFFPPIQIKVKYKVFVNGFEEFLNDESNWGNIICN